MITMMIMGMMGMRRMMSRMRRRMRRRSRMMMRRRKMQRITMIQVWAAVWDGLKGKLAAPPRKATIFF